MSSNFGGISPLTSELAALEGLKNRTVSLPLINLKNLLLENYSKCFDDLLSGERSLPFGLLVNQILYVSFKVHGNENLLI